jgi:hypothetical protein
MAAREDQSQSIVGDRHVGVAPTGLVGLDAGELRLDRSVPREFLRLVPQSSATAQPVDGPIARRRRDPRARVVRDTADRPGLERRDERLLDGLLGQVEVAEDTDERRDGSPRLVSEQAIDDLARGRVSRGQSAPTACAVASVVAAP